MARSGAVYLGVDIGGTKVAAGLVTAQGRILSHARVAMPSQGDAAAGLKAVQQAMTAAVAGQTAPVAIGLSSPGPLDPRRGIVLNPPNLPCWHNFRLVKAIQRGAR
ncbi:MAG: ROK family protein, partial [Terriglobales bacterium]